MKSYLTAFAATFFSIFMILWAVVRFDFGAIADREYEITKAHEDLIARCDLGNVDIFGDSTGNADLIPSRIGPQVRDLAFGGGTPVETYFIAKSILKCPNRPKIVILTFVPADLGSHSTFPQNLNTFFWLRAFKYGIVNYADAIDVLKYSTRFHDSMIVGPPSLMNADFRIKAALYSVGFPPYFYPDFTAAVAEAVKFRVAKNPIVVSTIYTQTMADNGHHFYGTDAEAVGEFDHSAFATDVQISPLSDFYLRRTIAMLARNGISVILVEPPADHFSAIHYPPGLVEVYQSYLANLQSTEPNTQLVGSGFQIWDPTLFGDRAHLNLRGAQVNSEYLRENLIAAGQKDVTLPDPALRPINLYTGNDDAPFWTAPSAIEGFKVSLVSDVPLPKLAYPGGSAWLYQAPSEASGSPGSEIRAPAISLEAKTDYALSVFVKPIDTGKVSLSLNWPGGSRGSVAWDFDTRLIGYSGMMNLLNSGVLICPGGWVELFLSATSGPNATSYPGPAISLFAANQASAYLYNVTLERGLWPANYCTLQNQEATTLPLSAKTAAGG